MNTRTHILMLVVIVLMLLTACGGGVNPAAMLEEARGYYTQGVRLETSWTASYTALQTAYSSGMQSILDQSPYVDQCFENTGAIRSALEGAYQVEGATDMGQLTSALVINQAFPDVSICQGLIGDIMLQIAAWRQNNADRAALNADYQREYTNFLNDDAIKRVLVQVVRDFSSQLEQHGIPASFVAFPTDNLEAQTRDQGICTYYEGMEAANPIYAANWNGALNYCVLERQAAYEYMTRVVLTSEASNRFDCGVDAGLNDEVTNDCEVISPTVAP